MSAPFPGDPVFVKQKAADPLSEQTRIGSPDLLIDRNARLGSLPA